MALSENPHMPSSWWLWAVQKKGLEVSEGSVFRPGPSRVVVVGPFPASKKDWLLLT